MRLSPKLRELFMVSGLYRPLLRIGSLTVNREVSQARSRMVKNLSTLVPPGSLVFDIGANTGSYAEIYCRMGCHVVAVEPNDDCIRRIRLDCRKLPIVTIPAAVGSKMGLACLHISDAWDATSTLSAEWMKAMAERDERYGPNWNRETVVAVLTLDSLISQFGEPYYLKIDVEGFELEVLRGLSTQPPLLSFEFQNTCLEAAYDCLGLPLFSARSRYNLIVNTTRGYHDRFEKPDWISREELRGVLSSYTKGDVQGDIFVRRPEG
jgi:FkbM family methyltransferase